MRHATPGATSGHARALLGRLVLGVTLAFASAAALVLAFPPYGVWPLVWVAFVPMLVAQYRVLPGPLSSLASAIAIGGWVWGFFGPVFGGTGSVMRYLPLAVFALVFVLDLGLRSWHARSAYRWFVLQGAVGWVAIEMVRGIVPSFGTWGFVAHTLHGQPWLIQPVATFGVFGLSLLVMLVNFTLGLAALAAVDARWARPSPAAGVPWRRARGWLVATGVAVVAWVAGSLGALHDPPPDVRVAAIQPAVSPLLEANRGRAALAWDTLTRMKAQTREAAAAGAAFVVWPEGALQFDPQVGDRLDLAGLARETSAYLAIGYVVDLPAGGFRNEATVIAPDGAFLGVFGKDHPVVFGGETSPTGGSYPVYDTPIGVLGTIVCFDLDFTDTTRELARRGAQLVGVPSQDWPSIARLHGTHLVFRAVENRVAMVKADGSFDSVIVDPFGRVLAAAVTPKGGEATLVADVPLGTADAPAVRLGDWVGWACLAAWAGFTLLQAVEGRRRPVRPGG